MINLPIGPITENPVFLTVVLISSILVLAGSAIILFYIYKILSKWLVFLQKEKDVGADEIKQEAYEKASSILDEAREKSMQLVAETDAKSKEVLEKVEQISSQAQQNVSNELTEITEQQKNTLQKLAGDAVNFYKGIIEKQKADNAGVLNQTSQEIKDALLQEVDEFERTLHDETVQRQAEVDKKIESEYVKVRDEIRQYREEQLKDIEKNIFDILHDVTKEVLGEALSLEGHQELILRSLEKAKEENLFDA